MIITLLFIIQYCLKWLPLLNSFCTNSSLYEALLTNFSFQKLSILRIYGTQLIMHTMKKKSWFNLKSVIYTLLTWARDFSKHMRMLESTAWLTAIRTIKSSSFIGLILFQTQINMNLVIVTITMITTPNQSTIFVNTISVWQRKTGRGPNKTRRFLIPRTTMP